MAQNIIEKEIKQHKWMIIKDLEDRSLYMDGIFIGQFRNNSYISKYIKKYAREINMETLNDVINIKDIM